MVQRTDSFKKRVNEISLITIIKIRYFNLILVSCHAILTTRIINVCEKDKEDGTMTNNEMLLAISDMMDKKLQTELRPIKEDIRDMKADMQDMKDEMQNVKYEMQDMKADIRNVQNDVLKINLCQENIILPRLATIESCYTDTYKRYSNDADRMERAFDDIELLKKVVTEHSEKLQKIS